MRQTCLRYPKRSKFIQIHEWQLIACDGVQTAAALLSVLEYRHNFLLENKEVEKAVCAALKSQNKPCPPEFNGWQFYTDEDLESRVLLWKKEAILKGVRKLEEKGFIDTVPPDTLKDLFKSGRQKWFRFRADKINKFLDKYNAELYPENGAGSDAPDVPPANADEKPLAKKVGKAKKISMDELAAKYEQTFIGAARIVFEDWKAVLCSPLSMETGDRLKRIIERIKEGYTPERLMLANRGICFLDHNMGINENGRGYWDDELIFRDAPHVERYERAALENGLTVENFRDYVITRKNRKLRTVDEAAAEAAEIEAEKPQKKPKFLVDAPADIYELIATEFGRGVGLYHEKSDILNNAAELMRASETLDFERLRSLAAEKMSGFAVPDSTMRKRLKSLIKEFLGIGE